MFLRFASVLLLLLVCVAGAEVKWTEVSPPGFDWSAKFPFPIIEDKPQGDKGHAWTAAAKGEGVATISVLNVTTTDAERKSAVDEAMTAFLKGARVTETSRKPIKQGGLQGVETVGTWTSKDGDSAKAYCRVLASPNRVYFCSALSFGDEAWIYPCLNSLKPGY